MKTRVLIVDDHRAFRDVLITTINRQTDMEVVGDAADGEKAIALTRELLPDVILMDVKMPIMDGTETTSRILAEIPGMKILALSIYADDQIHGGHDACRRFGIHPERLRFRGIVWSHPQGCRLPEILILQKTLISIFRSKITHRNQSGPAFPCAS